MNIVEALDAALPEMPAKSMRRTYPKLDPQVISKEHIEHGMPTVLAKMPGSDSFVRLTPEQWKLLELFDGERSYQEVAALTEGATGFAFTEDDVKEFSSFLQDKTDLFYRTPLDKNVTLKQKTGADRYKRKRLGFSDITDITLHRWPKADDYLTKLQPYVSFVYTPWFTLLTLCCFGIMFWMWADKFGEIWNDSFRFYNFSEKGVSDLFEFWFLFGAMAFFHESAHGMTCKQFGARVEKMEFLLMYFAPTFVCDVTQIWIIGERKARLYTIIAGIWIDLIICFVATIVWWTTAPGMWTHDFAYKVIMVSGIGVTLLNLNPLIKLDGYYMFSELLGEADLKERSTLWVSDWVKRNLFRLPVEVEYVPRRRRFLYLTYALLSGIYSYLLIIVVVSFAYNVFRSFSPEFAWIPGLAVAYLIFKSRIWRMVRFMKDVYLDKKDRLRRWTTGPRLAALCVVALALLFAPIWQDFVQGRFVLEPAQRAMIRAEVPGVVTQVLIAENQPVASGAVLVRMRNLQLESAAASADADVSDSSARARDASLHYAGFGAAERERQRMVAQGHVLADEVAHLTVTTPIAGTVVTPRMSDLQGSYLPAGAKIAEVADASSMVARIYIPEYGVRDVKAGSRVRLQMSSRLLPISATLASLGLVNSAIDPGLMEKAELNGITPPPYYIGLVNIPNDGSLREGMTGTAKLLIGRRSLAEMIWRFVRDSFLRRFW